MKIIKRIGYLAVAAIVATITSLVHVGAVFALSGTGTSGDPYIISSCADFKDIADDLDAYYSLTQDINCTSDANTIRIPGIFSGNLNGNNHTITVAIATSGEASLFHEIRGTVTNLTLAGSVSTDSDANDKVGGMAIAIMLATFTNVTIAANVAITDSSDDATVGGLAAESNESTLTNVVGTGNVNGQGGYTGGLLGFNGCLSTITNSHTTGTIENNGPVVGGITGFDGYCEGPGATYSNVYSAGTVVADGNVAGGVVGQANGVTLNGAYSTGDIGGINNVGGVVGVTSEYYGISLTDAYSTGTVSGNDNVGGVVGYMGSSVIDRAYSTAAIEGHSGIGGLVGTANNGSSITRSFATGAVHATNDYAGGLVGFLGGGSGATVRNSYARSNVTSDHDYGACLIGFVGSVGNVYTSYCTGQVNSWNPGNVNEIHQGGIAPIVGGEGNSDGLFWDTTTSGTTESSLGTGKTTAEMKNVATFTSSSTTGIGAQIWDFRNNPNNDAATDDVWDITSTYNDGYPCLVWSSEDCQSTTQTDSDGDGAPDANEDGGPNGGDANNDGTPDSQQDNVVAFQSGFSGKTLVLEMGNTCEIQTVAMRSEDVIGKQDGDFNYADGMMHFTADCGTPGVTTTVKQFYYDTNPDGLVMRKYSERTGAYSTIEGTTYASTTIAGHTVTTASYQVTDGGALDDNVGANGIITDPAGLASTDTSQSLADTGMSLPMVISAASADICGGMVLLGKRLRFDRR